MSTTSRILLGFLLFLAAGLYFLAENLTERVEREYFEAAEESMVDVAQIFASALEQTLGENGELQLEQLRQTWTAAHERPFSATIYGVKKTTLLMNAYVTDHNGMVVFDSDNGRAEGLDYRNKRDVALTLAGKYGARSTRTNSKDDSSSVMFVAAPIRHAGTIVGVVSLYKPQSSLFSFRDETRLRIRTVSLMFFAAVTAGAYLVVTLFSRPIRRLTEYARAVARGERGVPPSGGSLEAVMLSRAFEEMRDSLEDRAYVEKYVQSVTHEMKSPVAAIRGAAELLRESMPQERREKFLANIQAEARRLQNIIDRLLALAALESRKRLEDPKPLDLAELAANVCAQLQPAAEAANLRLHFHADAHPEILGDPFLLENALHNVLQNAIEFSPPNSLITVDLTLGERFITLQIQDEGPGVPDYALPRLFERFYSLQRPNSGRKSSGLGLCFVRETMALHGGEISIKNRSDRSGVQAQLRWPLSTP